MRMKILSLLVLILILNGCETFEGKILSLEFIEVKKVTVNNLLKDTIDTIIDEKNINDNHSVFLYQSQNEEEISVGIRTNKQYYNLGELSMQGTPEELMGITEVKVLGEKAIKIHGILGANYAHSYYWFHEDGLEGSIIHVDGYSREIDIDDDNIKEIVSENGTISETIIYELIGDEILVLHVNESIGAKAVHLQDIDKKIFEVHFEQNELELYKYKENSFRKMK